MYYNKTYYWVGEHKDATTSTALKGIRMYSSKNLYDWKNEGIVLSVEPSGSGSDIEQGCVMERPKVVYNKKTKKLVMWFYLELKKQGVIT